VFDEDTSPRHRRRHRRPERGRSDREVALAIEMGCEAADIGLTIHPHPTLSESVGMAAEVYEGTVTERAQEALTGLRSAALPRTVARAGGGGRGMGAVRTRRFRRTAWVLAWLCAPWAAPQAACPAPDALRAQVDHAVAAGASLDAAWGQARDAVRACAEPRG
jgi:hypothetical protein